MLIGKVAVLGTTLIATRLLPRVDAGELFVGLAAGALLGSMMAIGLPEAISRSIGSRSKPHSADIGSFIAGAFTLWLVVSVIIIAGASALAVVLGIAVFDSLPVVTCILGALVALESILATFMRVDNRPLIAELCVSLGSIVFAGALLAIALAIPVSGVGALWTRCGIDALIGLTVAYITIQPQWHLRHTWSIRENTPKIIKSALPLWLTSFSWFVLQNIGIVFLAIFSGPAAVALYQPLLKIADTAGGIASMFGPYLLPVAARLRATGSISQVNKLYIQASRVAFALSVPVLALLAFDSNIIATRLFGISAQDTELVAILLACAYLLNATVGFNGVILEALAFLRTLASRSLVVVLTALIANAILIAYLGVQGAAYGTLIGYFAINALNSVLLYRATQITPFQVPLLSPLFVTLLGAFTAIVLSLLTYIPLTLAGPLLSSIFPLAFVLIPIARRSVTDRRNRPDTPVRTSQSDNLYGADSSAARP
jgi:O-antigen/teichoic acid export membrane protein